MRFNPRKIPIEWLGDKAMMKWLTCKHKWGVVKGTKSRPYQRCKLNCGHIKYEEGIK